MESRRGNLLTYRETSISKVKCVSRVVTVIGCYKIRLIRILEKSVTLILTVKITAVSYCDSRVRM